jgi:hypothetical protein
MNPLTVRVIKLRARIEEADLPQPRFFSGRRNYRPSSDDLATRGASADFGLGGPMGGQSGAQAERRCGLPVRKSQLVE